MRLLEGALACLVVVAALLRRSPARRLPAGVDADDLAQGYEHSDARVRWIVAGLGVVVLAVGLVVVVASALEADLTGIPVTLGRPPDLVDRLNPAPTPPPPRLETTEGEQFAAYQSAEAQHLRGYGWVDRASGTVSIPIDRAMDLVAQRGLPARAASTARDQGVAIPSSASSGRVDERVTP